MMMDSALTESCILMGDILQRMIDVFSGLSVFPERMRQNLDLSGGLIMSEAIMLELGREIGRQRGHDVVYDAAQASVIEGRPFRDLLEESDEVKSRLSPQQLEQLLDPTRYTGACELFATQNAKRARETAKSISGHSD